MSAAAVSLMVSTTVTQLTSAQANYHNRQHDDVIRDVNTNVPRTSDERILMEVLLTMSKLQGDLAELRKSSEKSRTDLEQINSSQESEFGQLKRDVANIMKSVNRTKELTTKVCPSDFKQISAIRGCYKVVLDELEWSVAALRCQSLHKDAHLVFINSATEQRYIASLLAHYSDKAVAACAVDNASVPFWTGGQRIDPSRRSTFVWKRNPTAGLTGATDELLEMTYTNWESGQPSFTGSSESCMNVFRKWHYRWNDWTCAARACPICEIDM